MKDDANISPGVEVATFGCRLNAVESEAMRRAATHAGLGEDVIIVNTCAVTNEAVRQARQSIRRHARERPGANIIVTGCAAQIDPARFAGMSEVNHVVGNGEKMRPDTWESLATAPRVQVGAAGNLRNAAHRFAVDSLTGQTRAFVEVQNGCDHRCTFCIIPYGRGPSRSASVAQIVEQVQRLGDNGYREVVLTGVDITSWGADIAGAPKLGRLVREILRGAPDIARLRLSSIDCIEADDELLDVVASEERFMPHMHLSLQAGDDLILKRMKRRHNRQDAIDFCQRLRALRPDMILGADIITGFPTETEEMFLRSLDLVDECSLTHLHVFPFSPRDGTPAARMPHVPREVAKERAARLRARGDGALRAHLDQQVGKRVQILSERGGSGRTRDFTIVRTPGVDAGRFLEAEVTGHDGRALTLG